MNSIKSYITNPFVAAGICMVLFVLMYNNATNGFLRTCSYVPLAVALGVFVKGMYYACELPID